MSPRLRAGKFSRFGVEACRRNRESMYGLVQAGPIPGLLAYAGERPVGWISLGPREQFARLRHSPTLRSVPDLPVTGLASTFRALGFSEVGVSGRSRGQPRLVMRYDLPGALSQ